MGFELEERIASRTGGGLEVSVLVPTLEELRRVVLYLAPLKTKEGKEGERRRRWLGGRREGRGIASKCVVTE